MRFQEAYEGWSEGRLTQAEAALLLGQCERSFRRHIERFEADGLDGLLDKRLSQISKRGASGAEIDQVVQLYKSSFAVLCEQYERKVDNDNCVSFEGMSLQIAADAYRHHYVRTTVRVHRYVDDTMAVFHGPRKLGTYDARGRPTKEVQRLAA